MRLYEHSLIHLSGINQILIKKVFLQPGESRTVVFALADRAFALWRDSCKVPAGFCGVEVGGLSARIQVDGEVLSAPERQAGSWYESCFAVDKGPSKYYNKFPHNFLLYIICHVACERMTA